MGPVLQAVTGSPQQKARSSNARGKGRTERMESKQRKCYTTIIVQDTDAAKEKIESTNRVRKENKTSMGV